jgi:multiple sugar transport system permease protein
MSAPRSLEKKKRISLMPYFLLAPMFLIVAAYILYPLIANLYSSFLNDKLTRANPSFIGLDNYRDVLGSAKIWQSVLRTFRWTIINVVFMSIIGLSVALLFTAKFKGRGFLKAVILIPWVLPQVVTGFTWTLMLSESMGIITSLMRRAHLVPATFSWFQSGGTAMASAIMANVWRGYPFFALMLFAKLSTIPTDQVEAAKLDGAHGIKYYWYILHPYIQGVLYTCMALSFLWTYNAYDLIKVMTNGGPAEGTLTIPLLIQREAFDYYNISAAATMSIVTFLIILALILLYLLLRKIPMWRGRKNDQ